MIVKYQADNSNDEFARMTPEEINFAIRHGVMMRKLSLQNNHKNHKGYNPDEKKAMRVQALGALAEVAACKILGLPVELTKETYNVADLAGNVQVRLIGADNYGLRAYPQDDPSWRILGIIILPGYERSGAYRVPGWCYAHEALANDEWKMAPHNRPPMYCVPQSFLRPVSELRQIIGGEINDALKYLSQSKSLLHCQKN